MAKKRFVPKIKLLEMIAGKEIVGPTDIVNYFDVTYDAASARLKRYAAAGLVEPLGSERGKWILTNKGYNTLEFLKKMQQEEKK